MSTSSTPRPLTTDEKKAAEAAFRGGPLDSKWSASARAIYEGITKVMGPRATLFEDTPVEQVATRSEVEPTAQTDQVAERSEEHTSELQSPCNLVCRLLLEKKKKKKTVEPV